MGSDIWGSKRLDWYSDIYDDGRCRYAHPDTEVAQHSPGRKS